MPPSSGANSNLCMRIAEESVFTLLKNYPTICFEGWRNVAKIVSQNSTYANRNLKTLPPEQVKDGWNSDSLNLAAVMFTTVQVSRLPLWRELLVSRRA
jgi:hypothetical protein